MIDTQFLHISQALGQDPTITQGTGGNTSIKQGDTMYIKASGTHLYDAVHKDIFTTVSVQQTLEALEKAHISYTTQEITLPKQQVHTNTKKQKVPSIETPLHALLPFSVVLHTHCIYSLAHSLNHKAEQNLAKLLSPYHWALLPYRKPGLSLAQGIQNICTNQPKTDVFILKNHGIIVGGHDCHDAFAKLKAVREALFLPLRDSLCTTYAQDFLHKANTLQWAIPQDPILHSLATDATSLHYASCGILHPEYAHALGTILPIAHETETAHEAYARLHATTQKNVGFLLYPTKGILLAPQHVFGASPQAWQDHKDILYALAQVCGRIEPHTQIDVLTTHDKE